MRGGRSELVVLSVGRREARKEAEESGGLKRHKADLQSSSWHAGSIFQATVLPSLVPKATSSSPTSSRPSTRLARLLLPSVFPFLQPLTPNISSIRSHDQDRDGALSPHELDSLFSTSPGNPWLAGGFPETTITSDSGAVTLQGWLAQWS